MAISHELFSQKNPKMVSHRFLRALLLWTSAFFLEDNIPGNKYMFKVDSRNNREKFEI